MTNDEFDDFLALAQDELEIKQASLQAEFGLGGYERFVADYEAGVITFFNKEAPRIEAIILPIATHVPDKNSLKWSWADKQLPQSIRDLASQVKRLHVITGFDMFANEAAECDEAMAWEITALACKTLSALGAYRVPHAKLNAYVLITAISHVG